MSQSQQNLEKRKENISSIEPLISAMRTISLSQWRMALNRQTGLDEFLIELGKLQTILGKQANNGYAQQIGSEDVLLVLGSNRGLCGNFNKQLLRFTASEGISIDTFSQIYLIGKQLPSVFKKIPASQALSIAFPDINTVHSFAQEISMDTPVSLEQKKICVLYNAYQGAGRYQPILEELYPISPSKQMDISEEDSETFIIDTDPASLAGMLEYLLFDTHLQTCLFSSMASEHSSRFAMMENADRNVENLINELEILLQDYRKGKITTETQELAVASGLLSDDK